MTVSNSIGNRAGEQPSDLLTVDGVSKAYAGVQALDRASFALRRAEVHALVGENGAGKSTLVKIISGAVTPDSGTLTLEGRRVASSSPRLARNLGIIAIYQQPALFPELTVAENIALGTEDTSSWTRVDWRARRARATELLARVGGRINPDAEAGTLSMPEQQLVEIARAVGANANILILDEPTASLSHADTANLFRVIRELKAQGVGMIYISHRLEELPTIADRVTVLRDGRTIDTRSMSSVTTAELIHLMVGRSLSSVFPKRAVQLGPTVLELRQLGCSSGGVHNISMSVRAGEILGVAGLVGAGRTELATSIFGLTPADSGEIWLRGVPVSIHTPADAIANGIAYLPEDRRHHGVVMEMAVAPNISLASLDQYSRRGLVDTEKERDVAASYVERLAVKTPSIFSHVSALSGGNQQKVALARWLATKPALLILDEPTQGVDVGAKSEIHSLMSDLAEQGVAIVMISSELPEILGMSDRIAVMRGGAIVGIVNATDATQARLLALALGEGDASLERALSVPV